MNMPLRTTETVMALPASSAKVLAIADQAGAFRDAACARTRSNIAVNVMPPVVVIALVLVVWEMLCRKPGATLPPPPEGARRHLGIDRRSVLRPRRPRQGPVLAHVGEPAARGVRLCARGHRRRRARHAGRPVDLGDARPRSDLPGAAHRAAARLAAAVARGVPQRPAVGDLRDLHHRDLADHHQHRGRHPQHPAGLSQRRAGAAAQPARVLLQDHGAGGGALHLHRACASASACRGSPSSRPRC